MTMTADAQVAQFTIDDIGCFFDNARGWGEIHGLVQDFARNYGWEPDLSGTNHSQAEMLEWLSELTDEAEAYLNDLTDGTVWFGSSESGDWGLWPMDSDEY